MRRALAVAAGLGIATWIAVGTAAVDPREFSDPGLEERFRNLAHELRCTVCQNQSLAESNAELAKDLRGIVHAMLEDGASDDDIVEFMVARYGQFVLYRPPLSAATVALWLGPFLLALVGVGALYGAARASGRHAASSLSAADRGRAARLLDADEAERNR